MICFDKTSNGSPQNNQRKHNKASMKWRRWVSSNRISIRSMNQSFSIERRRQDFYQVRRLLMVYIKMEVSGVTEISRNLRIAIDNLKSLWPFFWDAINAVHDRSNMNFKTNWSSANPARPWLSPSTQEAREKRRGGYKKEPNKPWVLRRTWELQENTRKQSNDNYWSLAYLATYAKYHQNGWRWLPKRKIIDIDDALRKKITKLLQVHINKTHGIFGRQL
jgi:hypothetical protein